MKTYWKSFFKVIGSISQASKSQFCIAEKKHKETENF